MAFQLKANEPVSVGMTRNVERQLEKALGYVSAILKQRSVQGNEAIFEIRKCFKRIRAALRLVRDDLGDPLYHQENFSFRDAARPLTEIRDAQVLIETVDKLKPEVDPKVFTKIRESLVRNQQEVNQRVLEQNKTLATLKDFITRAMARLHSWRLTHDGWDAIEPGLRRVYRAGHRASALAEENPTMENLHEWRKQAKYLWHQLQLLESTLPPNEKALIDQTHKLATLLGEDHDLAVLRSTLAADPLAYGGHRALKDVFARTDHRRRELEQQAFALGGKIYRDPPKAFTKRMEEPSAIEVVR